MAHLGTTLNAQQLAVLTWIGDGCPDGVMQGHTYKATAVALENRRLVTVARRRSGWRAELTATGTFYLSHGRFPNQPADARQAGGGTRPAAPQRTTAAPPAAPSGDAKSPPAPETAGPAAEPTRAKRRSPVEQLIADLTAAGGVLRVQRPHYIGNQPTGVDYEQLIRSANRFGKVPPGQRLTTTVLPSHGLEIRLEAAVPGTQVELRPVPVAEHVARYHPVVVQFRETTNRHEISRQQLPRALRLLHALVTEAERRGHTVELSPEPAAGYGYRHWTGANDGHITISVGGHSTDLRILEEGMPSRAHWERTNYHGPAYTTNTGTGRLRIECTGYGGREGRTSRWSDGQQQRLADKLPAVLAEVEIRAAEDAHRHVEAARRAAEEQRRRDQAQADAHDRYLEAERGRQLLDQAHRWRLAQQARAYLDAVRTTVAAQTTGDATTEAWLSWAQTYVDTLDPLHDGFTTPAASSDPTTEQLHTYLTDQAMPPYR
ncbi:hypothetical protein [Dactylosporangium sp. NPDC051484]|uniref:hypothetical protein n=1 Tax=Dactylosporangium sp. NPDC051484 TaxID=3154942 RepID=UPI00344C4CDA